MKHPVIIEHRTHNSSINHRDVWTRQGWREKEKEKRERLFSCIQKEACNSDSLLCV
jgi:hypothetical protein